MTRIGLVLGAGGLLGSAWTTGALSALERRLDRPLGELDLVVGTSAGSVLGAALRCGMSVDELLAHQRGAAPGEIAEDLGGRGLPDMRTIERESGDGLPPIPLPWIGSPRLLASAIAHPLSINPVIAAAGLLPAGRGRMASLIRMVAALQSRLGIPSTAGCPARRCGWWPWTTTPGAASCSAVRAGRRRRWGRRCSPRARSRAGSPRR